MTIFIQESVDSLGVPGWNHVDRLAEYLVGLKGLAQITSVVDRIVNLYSCLNEYDKGRTVYSPRHRDQLTTGRFKASKRSSSKSSVTPGVDSVRR